MSEDCVNHYICISMNYYINSLSDIYLMSFLQQHVVYGHAGQMANVGLQRGNTAQAVLYFTTSLLTCQERQHCSLCPQLVL
jgi:hypothetical protein